MLDDNLNWESNSVALMLDQEIPNIYYLLASEIKLLFTLSKFDSDSTA